MKKLAVLLVLIVMVAMVCGAFLLHKRLRPVSVLPAYRVDRVFIAPAERDRITKALGFEGVKPRREKQKILYESSGAKLVFRLSGRGGFLYRRREPEGDVPDVRAFAGVAVDNAYSFLKKHNLLPADSNFGRPGGRYYTNDRLACACAEFHPGKIPLRTRVRMIEVKVSPTREILEIDWSWAKLTAIDAGPPRDIEEAKAKTPFEPDQIKGVQIEYSETSKGEKSYLVPYYGLGVEHEGWGVSVYPSFDDIETGD